MLRTTEHSPVQPSQTTSEQKHPKYAEYCAYRSAVASRHVVAANFRRWLDMMGYAP